MFSEPDASLFSSKLVDILDTLQQRNFGKFKLYLQNNYLTEERLRKWRAQDRVGTAFATNMALERFHGILKGKFFQHSENRRLDQFLSLLFKAITYYIRTHRTTVIYHLQLVALAGSSKNDRRTSSDREDAQGASSSGRLLWTAHPSRRYRPMDYCFR
jgi:hypothetical protein